MNIKLSTLEMLPCVDNSRCSPRMMAIILYCIAIEMICMFSRVHLNNGPLNHVIYSKNTFSTCVHQENQINCLCNNKLSISSLFICSLCIQLCYVLPLLWFNNWLFSTRGWLLCWRLWFLVRFLGLFLYKTKTKTTATTHAPRANAAKPVISNVVRYSAVLISGLVVGVLKLIGGITVKKD